MSSEEGDDRAVDRPGARSARADAIKNQHKILQAAAVVFDEKGLDAPMRDIANLAGVGVGTIYRRFPRREDLIAGVFQREMDHCADAAPILAARHPPFEALREWIQLFTALAVAKRGLAAALLTTDPAFEDLPARREERLRPAFRGLFRTAVSEGVVRDDVNPDEFMDAVSSLCMGAHDVRLAYAQRMTGLLVDALRHQPG